MWISRSYALKHTKIYDSLLSLLFFLLMGQVHIVISNNNIYTCWFFPRKLCSCTKFYTHHIGPSFSHLRFPLLLILSQFALGTKFFRNFEVHLTHLLISWTCFEVWIVERSEWLVEQLKWTWHFGNEIVVFCFGGKWKM